ncbi:MBL fold metallo-hydrolase [Salinadaptatus halalkaliphilus]|uniref:MBL fold metallo-hydrolase n=1 Tax=Salinadaptatus halalkaliphilus TaxID=2419781 RepID=A0A4S3TI14_9EURY|nr:alkyl sulfatase dimerization domain-containing protein [Salinadaptatus halalkaliphilus]THE63684.1 MBL fold metallo-hydrolase [Salinadaptatus halalkaliphilus]
MADDATDYRDIGWVDEPLEVTDETYYISQFSAVTVFETAEGLVLIDAGLDELGPKLNDALREFTDEPVHTAVFTHGHADHVHGLRHFLTDEQESPRIIAHEAMPKRWARYERTAEHNDALNARQFGGAVSAADDWYEEESNFRTPDLTPTVLYDDELTIEVGDTAFEIHHGRGETDDHSWVYCPDRDVVCTGDFFISMAPNAGNPQKVQRYPEAWATALREIAALEPRHLCPGHGSAVVDDPAGIRTRLEETAAYLESIVEQTLEALNNGSPPHVDIAHAVDPPDTESPWLDEIYDESEFIVRNLLRLYGGWWTGRPSELKPAPRQDVAKEMAALAGGPTELIDRAESLWADDQHRVATHLVDYAVEVAPEDERIQERAADLYDARAEREDSLMAANLYRSAAAYADAGRPFR